MCILAKIIPELEAKHTHTSNSPPVSEDVEAADRSDDIHTRTYKCVHVCVRVCVCVCVLAKRRTIYNITTALIALCIDVLTFCVTSEPATGMSAAQIRAVAA